MDENITTTTRIISISRSFPDQSCWAEIKVEARGAGQTVTHTLDLPLDQWQYEEIVKARIAAHQKLGSRLRTLAGVIRVCLGPKDRAEAE